MIRGAEDLSDMFPMLTDLKIAIWNMSSDFDPKVDFRVWAKWTLEILVEALSQHQGVTVDLRLMPRLTVPCVHPGHLRAN